MIVFFLSCILFESAKITHPDSEEDPCFENPACLDLDGDGFRGLDNDCDDENPNVHPAAEEICDEIDNNCNELIDDQEGIELSGMILGYLDADGDGFAGDSEKMFCALPDDYQTTFLDCDDGDEEIHPAADEVCDEVDNNCNELIDQDDFAIVFGIGDWYYRDADGDGFGVETSSVQACSAPDSYASQFGDCAPNDATIFPAAIEILNDRIDQDCDGFDEFTCFFGACALTISLDVANEIGIDFLHIPAGEGYLEDNEDGYSLLQDMMVMSTEWTQDMMSVFETLSFNTLGLENTPSSSSPGLEPVANINWHEAAYLANLLTQFENAEYGTSWHECYSCNWDIQENIICGLPSSSLGIYACDGYRLPTSAEWEYVARAGATADFSTVASSAGEDIRAGFETSCDNSELSEGSELEDYAWFCINNYFPQEGTKNVAQKDASPWGLFDIYGNVREWTHDDTSSINVSGENPTTLSPNNLKRLVRGGSFDSSMSSMSNGFKASQDASSATYRTGVRFIRSAFSE